MLKSLEAERNLYEMRQILPLRHDVFGNEDRNDLLEHWNENELDEWRGKECSSYSFTSYFSMPDAEIEMSL